ETVLLVLEKDPARPVGRWERAVKWARRRPAAAALVAVSVAAAAALLVVGLVYDARLRDATHDVEAEREAARLLREQTEELRRGAARGPPRPAARPLEPHPLCHRAAPAAPAVAGAPPRPRRRRRRRQPRRPPRRRRQPGVREAARLRPGVGVGRRQGAAGAPR